MFLCRIIFAREVEPIKFGIAAFFKFPFIKLSKVEVENMMNNIKTDMGHHFMEHIKCFTFIFNKWIFLPPTTQTNAFFKMIKIKHMLLPCLIDSF